MANGKAELRLNVQMVRALSEARSQQIEVNTHDVLALLDRIRELETSLEASGVKSLVEQNDRILRELDHRALISMDEAEELRDALRIVGRDGSDLIRGAQELVSALEKRDKKLGEAERTQARLLEMLHSYDCSVASVAGGQAERCRILVAADESNLGRLCPACQLAYHRERRRRELARAKASQAETASLEKAGDSSADSISEMRKRSDARGVLIPVQTVDPVLAAKVTEQFAEQLADKGEGRVLLPNNLPATKPWP